MTRRAPLLTVPGIGERLYALLRAREMTQLELANRAGVSRQTLTTVLRENQISAPVARRLERALELPEGALLQGVPQPVMHEEPAGAHGELARLRRLPPRARGVVEAYVGRLVTAGVPPERVSEAVRLMTVSNFGKLHARDPRERSEDELITDIDAAWAAISTALRAAGFRV